MRKIGVPPNAEMQAKAEGRDPSSIKAEVREKSRVQGKREKEGGRKTSVWKLTRKHEFHSI